MILKFTMHYRRRCLFATRDVGESRVIEDEVELAVRSMVVVMLGSGSSPG